MPKSKEPSEADIVFNRANVALAKNQRLVASWLSPLTTDELANAKSLEEVDKEETEMFAPVPELLGVGATPPKDLKDGLSRRSGESAIDRLRKQLVGKKATATVPSRNAPISKLPAKLSSRPHQDDDSDDDEESRAAALVSSKSSKISDKKQHGIKSEMPANDKKQDSQDEAAAGRDETSKNMSSEPAKKATNAGHSKKRPSNYLDELLGGKGRKRKKK